MDRREDGQPEFGGTCAISKPPTFSIPFETSDYHETLRWLLTTKRFLMVKIPIMVVHAHPGRGKKAHARNEHIFDAVVGLAAGLGKTLRMICGDLQDEPRRQSRHLDFALSQGWLTAQGQTHKPGGYKNALRLCIGQRPSRTQTRRAQDHSDLGHLRTEGVDDVTTHDSECGRPATPGTHLSEKMETSEPRVRTGHHGSKELQSAKKKERSDEQSLASDHGCLCTINADPDSSQTEKNTRAKDR